MLGSGQAVELVGRATERERVWRALNGPGAPWVYIHGPAGVGKSSLVQDLHEQRRVPLVLVQCVRDEMTIEGAAFRRLIEAVLTGCVPRDSAAWEALRLLRLDWSSGGPRIEFTEEAQARWVQVLSEALAVDPLRPVASSSMAGQPMAPVIVIEDAQWMDGTTQVLLGQWQHREAAGGTQRVVITSRLAPGQHWAGGLVVVDVAALTPSEAHELLEREVIRLYGWHPQALPDCAPLLAIDPTPFAVRWVARQWVAAAQRGVPFLSEGEDGVERTVLRRSWSQLASEAQRFVVAVWLGRDIVLSTSRDTEAVMPLGALLYQAVRQRGLPLALSGALESTDEVRAAVRSGWVEAAPALGWRLAHDRLAQFLEGEAGALVAEVEAAVAEVIAPMSWSQLRECSAGVLHSLWQMAERSVGGVLAERLRVALAARYFWNGMAEMCEELVSPADGDAHARLRLRYAVASVLRQDQSDAAAAALVRGWVTDADALGAGGSVATVDGMLRAGLYAEWLAIAAMGAEQRGVVAEALAWLRTRPIPRDTRAALLAALHTQLLEYSRLAPEVGVFDALVQQPPTTPPSWIILGWPASAHDDQAERMAMARIEFYRHIHIKAWDQAAAALLDVLDCAPPLGAGRAAFMDTLGQLLNVMSLGRIQGLEWGYELADALAARARALGNTTQMEATLYHQLLARMTWLVRPHDAIEIGRPLWRMIAADGDAQSRAVVALSVHWRAALLAGATDLRRRAAERIQEILSRLVNGQLMFTACLAAEEALASGGRVSSARARELVQLFAAMLVNGGAHLDTEVGHFLLCRNSLPPEERAEGDRLVREYLAGRKDPSPIRPFLLAIGQAVYGATWDGWMAQHRPVMIELFDRHQRALAACDYRERISAAVQRLVGYTTVNYAAAPYHFEEVWNRAQVEAHAVLERASKVDAFKALCALPA